MKNENLIKKIEQLQNQRNELLWEIQKLKKKQDKKIGYIFSIIGIALLLFALIYTHYISAFIGISLIFWGVLFFYIHPEQFVKKQILDAIISEQIMFYNKFIDELGYLGNPLYISPGTLWGLRNAIIYIPKENSTSLPSSEQLTNDKIFITNSQSVVITPPGQGLLRLIEEELKTDFSSIDIEYIQNNLERALVEGLEIVEEFHMESLDSKISVEIKNSVFFDKIKELYENKMLRDIGDPLNSAIASIIAICTRNFVKINNIIIENKEKLIKTDFIIIDKSKE